MIGEEFGLIACLIIVMVFAFVVMRGFLKVMREEDPFLFLASSGLTILFGLQGRTILDRPAIIAAADRLGLFVWGEAR